MLRLRAAEILYAENIKVHKSMGCYIEIRSSKDWLRKPAFNFCYIMNKTLAYDVCERVYWSRSVRTSPRIGTPFRTHCRDAECREGGGAD